MKQSTKDNKTRNLYLWNKIKIEEEGERKFLFTVLKEEKNSDDTLTHKHWDIQEIFH